jgi:hypothetical protein
LWRSSLGSATQSVRAVSLLSQFSFPEAYFVYIPLLRSGPPPTTISLLPLPISPSSGFYPFLPSTSFAILLERCTLSLLLPLLPSSTLFLSCPSLHSLCLLISHSFRSRSSLDMDLCTSNCVDGLFLRVARLSTGQSGLSEPQTERRLPCLLLKGFLLTAGAHIWRERLARLSSHGKRYSTPYVNMGV